MVREDRLALAIGKRGRDDDERERRPEQRPQQGQHRRAEDDGRHALEREPAGKVLKDSAWLREQADDDTGRGIAQVSIAFNERARLVAPVMRHEHSIDHSQPGKGDSDHDERRPPDIEREPRDPCERNGKETHVLLKEKAAPMRAPRTIGGAWPLRPTSPRTPTPGQAGRCGSRTQPLE